jgi:hypothetical protein
MEIYEKQDFIDFCRSKGDEKFQGANMFACAMTQFMKSKNPNVCRSLLLGNLDPLRVGTNDNDSGIVGLRITYGEAFVVVDCKTFAGVATALEE